MQGLRFDNAWAVSWAAVIWPHDTGHRRQWKAAVVWAREEYRAAYEQRPTRHSQMMRDFHPDVLYAEDDQERCAAA